MVRSSADPIGKYPRGTENEDGGQYHEHGLCGSVPVSRDFRSRTADLNSVRIHARKLLFHGIPKISC